ncbi:MAG TPA: PQQ-binding-like beta-propeller repeat protein [Nocardioides sp.]|nr:PQQ-binding-like beta-propeller repeat protein [Nocardioides sp.]
MHGPRIARGVAVAALLVVGLTACGGSDENGTTGPPASSASGGAHELWSARYDSRTPGPDTAGGVAISPDGTRVFVTGATATIAYDAATGEEAWRAPGEFPRTGGSTAPPAIAVSPDGDTVLIAAEARVLAYAAEDGQPLWVASFGSASGHAVQARAIAFAADGGTVYVHGSGATSGRDSDLVTAAYDAADGTIGWTTRTGTSAGSQEMLWPGGSDSLAVAADGSAVYATGTTRVRGHGTDFLTVALRPADGKRIWAERYDGGQADLGAAVAVTPDGARVVVTGSGVGPAGDADMATVAYDAASADAVWFATWDGLAHHNDGAGFIAMAPDGSAVFVAGTSEGATTGHEDYATLAYATDSGQQLWAARYDGPAGGDDNASGLAVSPDGSRVCTTGWSDGTADGADIATVAYAAASGATSWEARYDGTDEGDEEPGGLAVTDDAVVVNGTSDEDMVTVAYDAADR